MKLPKCANTIERAVVSSDGIAPAYYGVYYTSKCYINQSPTYIKHQNTRRLPHKFLFLILLFF